MCDILKHTTMKTGDKAMKKIHRTLSLFTVAAMCTALLCSCGEVPDSSRTDSSSKAATTTTADTTADTTTTGEASSTASFRQLISGNGRYKDERYHTCYVESDFT